MIGNRNALLISGTFWPSIFSSLGYPSPTSLSRFILKTLKKDWLANRLFRLTTSRLKESSKTSHRMGSFANLMMRAPPIRESKLTSLFWLITIRKPKNLCSRPTTLREEKGLLCNWLSKITTLKSNLLMDMENQSMPNKMMNVNSTMSLRVSWLSPRKSTTSKLVQTKTMNKMI